MARLPLRYAPFLFAVIQAGLTTGFATAIATHQAMSFGARFWTHWLSAWGLAWLTMVPIVIAAAPFIQRSVLLLIEPATQTPSK